MKFVLVALSLTVFSLSLFAQHVPKQGLLAHYPFSSNANDSSGNGYHMSVNGATPAPDRYNRPGKAFTFDGIDDLISYSSLLPVGGSFTWSFWLKIDGAQNSLVVYNGEGNINGYGFAVGNSTIGSAGTYLAFFSGGINYNMAIPLQVQTWHHIVLTKDNIQFKLYLDNILRDSTSNPVIPPVGKFYVGLDYTDGTNPFDGLIDDITVYDRAVTLAEIDTLFNGCGGQISAHPINTNFTAGSTSKFFITTNSAVTSYQWQINSGTGYTNLSNAGPFSGINSDTLRIDNATAVLNNNDFRVIITNSINCSDTSQPAKLIVCTSQITSPPSNLSVVTGNAAKFYMVSSPGMHAYQWQMDQGTGYVNLSNGGSFSGADTDTLKVSGASVSLNNSLFRVIVTNNINCTDTSQPARLNVWLTDIENVSKKEQLLVYPNPSRGDFVVDLGKDYGGPGLLMLYDLIGRAVFQQNISTLLGKHSVQTNLRAGVYILRVTSLDGKLIGRHNIVVN